MSPLLLMTFQELERCTHDIGFPSIYHFFFNLRVLRQGALAEKLNKARAELSQIQDETEELREYESLQRVPRSKTKGTQEESHGTTQEFVSPPISEDFVELLPNHFDDTESGDSEQLPCDKVPSEDKSEDCEELLIGFSNAESKYSTSGTQTPHHSRRTNLHVEPPQDSK
ncbi:uncharacterized protein DFL_000426 [Arthrobotrys flagrans]|uniref:Uncharacterized protein n=1 Tax=Arthrobotrys flagrans TaxID=97331 RepID=A0A437AE30_ARTFL|nr:hypothetical protein DFL_000426 [Arthrobotrys flagrans]